MSLTVDVLRQLAPSAFAIAMLGAIESLLSAVVADGMTGTRHDPDAELVAQGVGNLVAPFFGGIAATGAIARTATNVRAGGRSPIASVVHAAFLLLATLLLAPLVGYLPMPALGALLVVVAWNMSDAKHCIHVLRVAPKSDVVVLLACLSLTVIFDMVVAVSAGVMLAALLFMRRMADITGVTLSEGEHPGLRERLPPGVVLYQIAGPLFFGAAQKAMSAMDKVAGDVSVVILDISSVPVMDATGLVNLESALERLGDRHALVVLVGVQAQPAGVLRRDGIEAAPGRISMCANARRGTAAPRQHLGLQRGAPAPVASALDGLAGRGPPPRRRGRAQRRGLLPRAWRAAAGTQMAARARPGSASPARRARRRRRGDSSSSHHHGHCRVGCAAGQARVCARNSRARRASSRSASTTAICSDTRLRQAALGASRMLAATSSSMPRRCSIWIRASRRRASASYTRRPPRRPDAFTRPRSS